ncbi:T9SS type A sorting domain-containing protein [Chryseobacterium soldanellicola]|nr:T9SS type A sorting domain-containing protein [Chryseobacterium soldanellicola]
MTSLFCKVNAQSYQTLNVTSGYGADLIANGTGASSSSTTESVDSPANGYVFMSADFVNGLGVSPVSGLPSSGLINSANTAGLSFQLASYSSSNALKLVNANDMGTLNFSTNPKASKLYMLATTGSGNSTADIIVTFADNTTQTFTNVSINDWYGGSSYAIKGIGRVSRVTDNIENNSNDPRLYEIGLPINAANQIKNISNVSVKKTSVSTGMLCVFGFSYKIVNSCIEPDNVSASNITTNSATISWSAVSGVSSYEIYQSTSNTPPSSSATPTSTGITGATTNLTGLTSATTYYVWVRSNCGASTSDWNAVGVNFTTPCGAVNAPYSEDFDSTAIASLPTCTSSQNLSAGIDWSVGDVTGIAGFSSNVIFVYTDSEDTNAWFYTKGINLQAGVNYTFTFDYSNLASPQNFKVAYGTSPINTSMVNLIQDYPDLNVGTSTPASFTITPASTGVYYFGFNNHSPATGNMGYVLVDNISLTGVSLATSENQLSNGVKVYPNPTSDYLYVKTDRKVVNVKIFDASGKLVISKDKIDQKIDVSQLSTGSYILTMKNSDGTSSTHNFIKK